MSAAPNARKAPHAIVPDIHALNFPTGRQMVNDSGATATAEAFFEMKTYTACKSRYQHNNTTRNPADRRASEVVGGYASKFKKIDRLFAAEIVGETDSVVGPFTAAQSRFFRGQVIPLCAGWFGEINEDFSKIIRTLAKEAAAGDDGVTISPLVNSDKREELLQSCSNSSNGLLALPLSGATQSISSDVYTTSEQHRRRQRLSVVRTTATTDGSRAKMVGLAGTRTTCPKVMGPSSSSEMGMNSMCIECT